MGAITQNPTIDLLSDKQPTIFYLDDGAAVFNCVGSPNGAVAANIGSLTIDNQTGNVYTKTTNTVNTGWVQISGAGGGAVTGSGVADQIAFWSGATALTGSTNFAWTTLASGQLGLSGSNGFFLVTNTSTTPNSNVSLAGAGQITIQRVSSSAPNAAQFFLTRIRGVAQYPNSGDLISAIVTQSGNGVGTNAVMNFNVAATENHSGTVGGSSFDLQVTPNGSLAPVSRLFVDGSGTFLTLNAQTRTISTATLPAINIGSFAGDPSTLVNGDFWYNSTTGKFRARQAGASVDVIGGGGGTPAGANGQFQYNNAGAFGGAVTTQGTTGRIVNTPLVITSGVTPFFQIITPADTNLTTLVEAIGMQFGGDSSQATVIRQHATGAIAMQREILFVAPTYSFVAASTIAEAYTVDINGAPITGTNATITQKSGLRVLGGISSPYGNQSQGFGQNANPGGQFTTSVGYGSGSGSDGATTLGQGSFAWGGIAIGRNAQTSPGINNIILANNITVAESNCFVVGGSQQVDNVYFGKGNINAAPTAYAINGTGGNGTDISGANINLFAGKGTGAGSPGIIAFMFARPSGSSATLNVFSDEVFYQYSTDTITHQVNLKSSTTVDVPATTIVHNWVVNTHASRTTRMTLNALDFGGTREGLRIQSSGSASMIGFLGAAAAIRQTGGALTAAATYGANEQSMLNKAYTCLQTFGLLT
jgi:hypothetical protein